MTQQKFVYDYKDAQLTVKIEAINDGDNWANNAHLMDAMQKVIQSAGCWKHFEFHVTGREYSDE